MRCAVDERSSYGDRFDPAASARRYGLPEDQALALWRRVRADATDVSGRCDERAARAAFDAVAQHIADRGRRRFEVGKWSRLGVELDDRMRDASFDGTHPAAAPGRITRVSAEWEPRLQLEHVDLEVTRDRTDPAAASGAALWQLPYAPELPAPVMRSAVRPEIDAHASELVERARRGGVALDGALRAQLEVALGTRLDGVRVHTGPDADAAARALGARAFAIGDDLVFRDGAYDPQSRAGRQLIAHEVAHTVQARRLPGQAGTVSQPGDPVEREADAFADTFVDDHTAGPDDPAGQREPEPAAGAAAPAVIYRQPHPEASPDVVQRYSAFLSGVYAAAERIVRKNIEAVQAWRSYVLEQLSSQQLGAQVFATGFEQVEQQAAANHAEHLLGPYANEPNPIRQQLYEHQMAGEWRACTGCHVSNQAWEADGRMREGHDPGVTPAELLGGHAGTGFPRRHGQSLDARIWTDPDAWQAVFAVPSAPRRPLGPTSAAPPATGQRARRDPDAEQRAALASARRALAEIQPRLQPLGDDGYKIIPSNVISRFGNAPPAELRSAIEAAFARRLDGYRQLQDRIRAHSIDYLEFDALVGMLRPMAAPDVQALIDADQRDRQIGQIITIVGLLLVDLISIVVPPVGIVAGALHVMHGAEQASIGADRSSATGLHSLMSPEQQASGAMMQMSGTLEVLGGALQVGMTAAGLGGPRGAGTGGRVVARQTRGAVTIEVLENRLIRATHAEFPGASVVMRPDGSFVAYNELGEVVGTAVFNPVGATNAGAAPTAAGAAAPRGGGAAASSTALARVPPERMSMAPQVPAGQPSMYPLPEISPFYTGGAREGSVPPTQYNPTGRGDNCGFASMSYAQQYQNPSGPMCTADDLYLQRLEQLGIPVDANLSRQLVFPERSYQELRPRPGYEPLFDDNGGNRLSEYTVPSTARALGIQGTEVSGLLRRLQHAFGRHASVEEAVEARVAFLEEERQQSADPVAVRRFIERERAELPGLYIVGSHSSAHYLTITVDAGGRITGFDPQNGASYASLDAVLARLQNQNFNLTYRVSAPMPPTGGAP